jgi:hypothetical protein
MKPDRITRDLDRGGELSWETAKRDLESKGRLKNLG